MDSPDLVKLFHRGAEADLFLEDSGPWKAVVKRRVGKAYRDPRLDHHIRRERTVRESSSLREAKKAGVSAPSLLDLDLSDCSITMTLINGDLARDKLDSLSPSESRTFFQQLGRQIGFLHRNGLVHGDLTTSNIILHPSGHPFILDFGMSSHSWEPEDRGVDLHLLQRSIATSHIFNARAPMRRVFSGYSQALGVKEASLSFRKLTEIARRGRYFAIR